MKRITTKRTTSMVSGCKGCKIDIITNTLIVNYKFYKASQVYGSPENNLVKQIKEDCPNIMISVKKGRNPKKAHPRKHLTYANMELYIETLDESETLKKVFETVKAESKVQPSPYKYVVDWFKEQFKDYNTSPVFEDNKLAAQVEKEIESNIFPIKRTKTA